jgi:hypothetical protein
MPPRRIAPLQGSLVQLEPSSGIEIAAEVIPAEQRVYPPSIGPPGSFVDVVERARFLTAAMDAFGQRNLRGGFDVASNSPQYKDPIEERYTKEAVPFVQEGARAHAIGYYNDARHSFWAATGLSAMRRGTRLASKKEVESIGKMFWRRFEAGYGSPQSSKKRDAYRRVLGRVIKNSEKAV